MTDDEQLDAWRHVNPARLISAANRLCVEAQTSGGVAGADAGLMNAIDDFAHELKGYRACLRIIEIEGPDGCEIGAGMPDHPLRLDARLIDTDAQPVEDEADKCFTDVARICGMPINCAFHESAKARIELYGTARAEKAERERDEANAVIAQIEKLPSVKMAKAIQMIIAQRTAPEKRK